MHNAFVWREEAGLRDAAVAAPTSYFTCRTACCQILSFSAGRRMGICMHAAESDCGVQITSKILSYIPCGVGIECTAVCRQFR